MLNYFPNRFEFLLDLTEFTSIDPSGFLSIEFTCKSDPVYFYLNVNRGFVFFKREGKQFKRSLKEH